MDGFLVVDKPAGMSSHGVVALVRRLTGRQRVGHTGTLDPFATGVLPLAVGQATKAIPFLDESFKDYTAVMRLGVSTDTQDSTGAVLACSDWQALTAEQITAVSALFTGRIMQTPPMFSAIKQGGVPLYRLARKGQEVAREPRAVTIRSLVIDRLDLPDVTFTVCCSRGTYVRTLAHDLGERLGCGAHLTALRRLRSGPFTLAGALSLDELHELAQQGDWERVMMPLVTALAHLPEIALSPDGAVWVSNGRLPEPEQVVAVHGQIPREGTVARLTLGGELVAVAEIGGEARQSAIKIHRLERVFL